MEIRQQKFCKTVAQAARLGRLEDLKELIKRDHPVDVSDNRGWKPIHDAAAENHPECLSELLLHESTCIDWQAHDGATALLLAIRSGSEECVHILLDGNANLNISEHMGITPLIAAVQANNVELVSKLLSLGADRDGQQYRGLTALHLGVELDHPDIVTVLLNSGARVDVKSDFGLTPLFLSAQHGHFECLNNILQHIDRQGQGDIVNLCADDGASPVFLAAQEGHTACLRLLFENGASANLMVTDPLSLPLHAALEFNHVDCLKLLLPLTDRQLLSSCTDPFNFSMLHNDGDATRCLIEASFDYNNCSLEHDYHPRILRYFNAEVNFSRNVGALSLLTINNGPLIQAQTLISAGISLNAPDASFIPPLLPALGQHNLPMAGLLIEHGCEVDMYHPKVVGNLSVIVSMDNWRCLDFILKCGAEVDSLFQSPQSLCNKDSGLLVSLPGGDDDDDYENEPGVLSTPIPFWRMIAEMRFLMKNQGVSVAHALYRILQFTSNVAINPNLCSYIDEMDHRITLLSLAGEPRSLLHLCRLCIRRCFNPSQLLDENTWQSLPLPELMLDYLQYHELP